MNKLFILILYIGLTIKPDLKAQSVFICTGNYSIAYHSKSDCRGLNNCKATIYSISEYDAVNDFDRRPCCICWKVENGCTTDYVGSIYDYVNPPEPRLPPPPPISFKRNAMPEVGIYLQTIYDLRMEWMQKRVNGIVYLIESLFNSSMIDCKSCDFNAIKIKQIQKLRDNASYLTGDLSNDYTFNSIKNNFSTIEKSILNSYKYYLDLEQ